jgi:hypothetical protein
MRAGDRHTRLRAPFDATNGWMGLALADQDTVALLWPPTGDLLGGPSSA